MRKILILAALLFASPSLAQTVTLPAARTAGGTPVLATPTVCLNPDGSACAAGGGGGAATIANGADVAQGSTTDAAYSDATGAAAGTLIAINKGQYVTAAALSAKLPASLGAKASTASLSITPASDATFAISASSLPLPAGAATSALQTTGNSTLTTINNTLGSPFQAGGALGAGSAIIGNVRIDQTTAGTTNGVVARGDVANGATDAGAPLKIGGKANGSLPTPVTAGQRADLWVNLYGSPVVAFAPLSVNPADGAANATNTLTDTQGNPLYLQVRPAYVTAAGTWDRPRGDTTGAWVGGHSTIATGQVAVTTSATLVAAARTGRQKIGVTVVGAVQCAFGNSGVTLSTGWPLAAVAYASDSWDTAAAIYAVCASNTTVAFREQY